MCSDWFSKLVVIIVVIIVFSISIKLGEGVRVGVGMQIIRGTDVHSIWGVTGGKGDIGSCRSERS